MTSQLNQNMIEQFFIDSGPIQNSQHAKSPSQSYIRRDQTFNLSLTSRESHHHNHRSHAQNTMKNLSDAENIISLGLNQLKKLDQFVQTYCSKSSLLGGQLEQVEKSVKGISQVNPSVFNDFMVLKEQALNGKHNFQGKKSCDQCCKMQQQNNIIQEECDQRLCSMEQRYESRIKQLQMENKKLLDQNMKQSIHHGVQMNVLKDANQKLDKRVKQLICQIQSINLERSELFQKTKNTEQRIKLDISKFRNTSITKNSTHAESLPRNIESMIFDPYSQSDYGDLINIFFTQHLSSQMKQHMESRDLRSSVQSDHKPNDIEKLVRMYENLIRELNQIKQFRKKHGVQLPRQETQHKRINILDNSKQASKLNQLPENITNLQNQNKQLTRIKKSLTKQNQNLIKNINELRMIQKNMLARHNNQIQNLKVQEQEMKELIKQLSSKLKQKQQIFQKTMNQLKSIRQIYQVQNKGLKYNFLKERQQKKKAVVAFQDHKGPLRIYCRFRPQLKNSRYKLNQKWMPKDRFDCPFDRIFPKQSSQLQIFDQVKRLLYCAFQGQNLCMLSFGSANSGKTFTLHGNKQQRGLVSICIGQIYKTAEQQKQNWFITQAQVSMLELYNDKLMDLNTNKKDTLLLQQSNEGHITLNRNVSIKVSNIRQMQQVYARGLSNRKVRKNQPGQFMQASSFFTIKLTIKDKKTQNFRKTEVCFVDLTTLQLNDVQSSYARKINFTISNLVKAIYLIKNKQKPEIKYKEAKTLCLLQKYLNKKSKVAFFVNLQPYQTQQNYHIMQLLNDAKKYSESQHTEKVEKTDRTSTSKYSHEKKFQEASLSKSPYHRDRRVRSSIDNYE